MSFEDRSQALMVERRGVVGRWLAAGDERYVVTLVNVPAQDTGLKLRV